MNELWLLCGTAASLGFMHTLVGPDHYLPFVAMSRVGRWSLPKTMVITVLCGVGHVLSSIVIGLAGLALGAAVFQLERIEGWRGDLAGWLLVAFGLIYLIWGLKRAWRNRPHVHVHAHENGTVHAHEHVHEHEHVHIHRGAELRAAQHDGMREAQSSVRPAEHSDTSAANPPLKPGGQSAAAMTPWILFTIFLFGPCEPLIPVLMYPAASGHWAGAILVAVIFSIVTIATMVTIVALAYLGVGALRLQQLERFSHALAGFVVLTCGAAIKLGL